VSAGSPCSTSARDDFGGYGPPLELDPLIGAIDKYGSHFSRNQILPCSWSHGLAESGDKAGLRFAAARAGGALLLQSVSKLPSNGFVRRGQRPFSRGLAHGRHQDVALLQSLKRPCPIELCLGNRYVNQNARIIANLRCAQGCAEDILVQPSATNVEDLRVKRTEAATDIVMAPKAQGIAGNDLAIRQGSEGCRCVADIPQEPK
jgi:hypothetical protein